MHNPFFYKNKLLYQTKVNLWGRDELFLQNKFKKKKWSFLQKKKRRYPDQKGSTGSRPLVSLNTFRYYPLTYRRRRRSIRHSFKNNLYLRKFIRFKYGRLREKELNNLFKNSNGFYKFQENFGSRFDVNLCSLFNILLIPVSVFHLRQNILHGKFMLNGLMVKSPNIKLQAFDIISFKLLDLPFLNSVYRDLVSDKGLDNYLNFLVSHLGFCFIFESLSKDLQEKLVNDLSLKLGGDVRFGESFNESLMEKFQFYSNNSKKIIAKKSNKIFSSIKFLDLDKIISILNQKYIKLGHKKLLKGCKKILCSNSDRNVFSLDKKFNYAGVFNGKVNYNNFEVKFNGQFIDFVFLGFSENSYSSTDKNVLQYLY